MDKPINAQTIISLEGELKLAENQLEDFVRKHTLAKAELEYHKAIRIANARLKLDGKTATEINLIIKGEEDVIGAYSNYLCAEENYKFLNKHPDLIAKRLNSFQSIYKRD